MATPFDRLMDTIKPHLPGVMDNAVRQELFVVCEEFFDSSNVWTEDIPFAMNDGDETGTITPFSGRILRLMYVVNSAGNPVNGVTMPDTQQGIIAFPFDMNGGTYTATVALTVADPLSRDAFPIVPNDLVTKHWRTLMYGVLSNMMVMPAKPFTNIQLAAYYQKKFSGGTSRAMNEANTGSTYGSQSWRFPQTFNRVKNNGR